MICSWCGYENLDRARFCGDCGRGIELDVVCESCSTANPPSYRYCDACGEPIGEPVKEPGLLPVTPTTVQAPEPAPNILASARTRLQAMGAGGWETATLISIVLLALGLRLISLTNIPPNIQADEADNLQLVYHIMANTGPGFFGIDWTQTPAFNLYLVSWFMGLFGESIVGARMASVVLSVLSLPVFYLVVRQYGLNKQAAIASTFLLATSLWYLHFSRVGWYNIHVALYGLLTILFATAAIRRENMFLYAAAGLFATFGLYGHPSGRMIFVALVAYMPIALALHKGSRKRLLLGYAVMISVALVLYLPHINFALDNWDGYNTRNRAIYIFNEQNRMQFGDKSNIEIIAQQTWNNFKGLVLLDSDTSYVGINARYIAGGRGFLDRFTSVLFWVGMIVSVLKWRHTLLWWVFFIVMLFPTQILSNATPDGGRSIGAAPVFYLFVALGIHWLFELKLRPGLAEALWIQGIFKSKLGDQWWFKSAGVVALILIAYMNVWGYFNWMNQPEAESARHPAIETADFEVWQSLQKAEAEAGRRGFNVGEWYEMKAQSNDP